MLRLTQILAAVLVLLAVALGGYAWWLGSHAPTASSGTDAATAPAVVAPTFPVVVTTRRVAAGETLAADALQVVQLPIAPPGALREVPAAIGRVPVVDLAVGALVMDAGLASGLALRLAEGERAVAIRADEVLGVANRVQPGDFVDVFVMLKTDGREVARSQARLLLSRQRVLAYGSASVDGLPATENGTTGNPAPTSAPARTLEAARTAVLAVPVQDVARLALAEANGRLLLALRHPGDTALPDAALFAALPAALRPIAGGPAVAVVRPIDQAQVGFAMDDLAGGGGTTLASPPSALPSPVLATVAPAFGAGPVARPRTAGSGSPVRAGIEIESIRGDKRETVSY
jgi:pilus assembly protein CpaB